MSTVEQLEQELSALRAELDELRGRVAATEPAERPAAPLSRRNLLRAVPVVAVGGLAAAVSPAPAAAATGDPLLLGRSNTAADNTSLESALVLNGPVTSHGDFWADSLRLDGISMNYDGDTSGAALFVQHPQGGDSIEVVGGATVFTTATGHAIVARAWGNATIAVDADDAHMRFAEGYNVGHAVVATANRGDAVQATTDTGHAITAKTVNPAATTDAVVVTYAGTSRALYAESTAPGNINGTITGVNDGHGIGLWGEQRNDTGSGFGVVGLAGKLGRGAQFTGGAAAVRMVPSPAASHPTTGKAGDFFVDSSTRLWFCQKASSGSVAATWKQLA